MRKFKTLAIALAIMVGTSTFANSEPIGSKTEKDASFEIKDLFKNNPLSYHKNLYGKVVFSLNEKREIVVHSVVTEDQLLRKYVIKNMENKVLKGKEWTVGKPYILPLKVELN